MVDRLRRLVLVRHGETAGQSSIRYYGATDVPLSNEGRAQAHALRLEIPDDSIDAVWSSTLCRAWESARIIAPTHAVHLERDFREVHFGRWEGLTREEIEAVDPDLYAAWKARKPDFAYPEGERVADFRRRIERGCDRLRASGADSVLLVAHKGVVRTVLELVAGYTLGPEDPPLGGVVYAWRDLDGHWSTGRPGSDPTCSVPPMGIPLDEAPD
jgi:broad specificity phosphatase PhoE